VRASASSGTSAGTVVGDDEPPGTSEAGRRHGAPGEGTGRPGSAAGGSGPVGGPVDEPPGKPGGGGGGEDD
jgi:hypothetical protein